MEIVQEYHWEEKIKHHLSYDYEDSPGSGFVFPCSEDGTPELDSMRPEGIANYKACLSGEVNSKPVIFRGIVKRDESVFHPTVGKCECGELVELCHSDGNTCSCGRCYDNQGNPYTPYIPTFNEE